MEIRRLEGEIERLQDALLLSKTFIPHGPAANALVHEIDVGIAGHSSLVDVLRRRQTSK